MDSHSTASGVTNLRLKYPGEDSLLFKGFSLAFRKGEKVLLLGPSGSGKSTLLQVLSGLVPDAVEIPARYDDRIVPERWGYVFQDPDTQFCMPYADEELAFTLENLGVPRSEMPGRIRRCLEQVGLELDDPHTLIQTFSQGMKQRLAIACALALEPDVWFLDEPTALLDPEGTVQVWDTLKQVAEGKTLIIVEHKIDEILDFVDRVVLLSADGVVIADGSPQDIFTHHKNELVEYGIWYPGVWDDYRPEHGTELREEHGTDSPGAQPPKPGTAAVDSVPEHSPSDSSAPVLQMTDFTGLRGGTPKISVDRAAVYPSEWICVVGPNGAGKSSLLLAVMRLIRTVGLCRVDGIESAKTERLAGHAAYVFQNPEFQFVTNSVQDEVAYSLRQLKEGPDQLAERVGHMLQRYGLDPYRKRHPYQLSMGQKRRLSVASAVVRETKLLLLDEPTFGQDAQNAFRLMDSIAQLRDSGTAILMVTHDLEIVRRFATRVWRIEGGRLAADTTPEAFFAQTRPAAKEEG